MCSLEIPDNFNIIITKVNPHIVWLQCKLPGLLKKYKIDVFWQPDFILPPRIKGCRYFVTVHDLSGYKLHNVALKRVEITFKTFLKKTCRDADKIIAISEYTKKDIVETLGIDENKVVVTYIGESHYDRIGSVSAEDAGRCMSKYGIIKPYFLFVGTINPRKNVLTIVKAFENFRRNGCGDAQLVIVGEYGWNSEDVMRAIEISDFKADIIKTGFVSEEEKEIFYRNAVSLVFPSILEGFGFPVIEAMSVGVPVITSNVSSLPEVGGDAALYINDYYDSNELSGVMDRVFNMTDDERKNFVEKGYKQQEKFSRETCAVETLRLFGAVSDSN